MRRSGRLGVMACVAMLAACSDATGVQGEPMELARARQLWDARQMDDYQMTVQMWASYAVTAVIRVRDGVPVSVRSVEDGEPLPPELFAGHDTVEELFAILQHAVDGGASHIDAAFHSRYGIPVQVRIDPSDRWLDDEHGFRVESFQRE